MSNWRDHGPVTDEDLVAYLDGKLVGEEAEYLEREVNRDRALDARLELMRRGERDFAQAYDLLLDDAPGKRLKQILKLAIDPPPPPVEEPEPPVPLEVPAPRAPREPWGGWRMLAAATVLLAVFSGGLVASRFVKLPGELPQIASEPRALGWRATVAYYQTLFVKETLENAAGDAQAQSANLRAALGSVGLDLSVDKVSVGQLQFKRAEVLSFRGKPLVQVAYLYKGETPVSFCIIKSAKPAQEVMAERREGMNIAHWRSSAYGFMVIGDVPAEALDDIAKTLKQRLS